MSVAVYGAETIYPNSYTKSQSDRTFATKIDLTNALSVIDASRVGGTFPGIDVPPGYITNILYSHPRGDAEMVGENSFSSYGVGLYVQLTTAGEITKVKAPIWGGNLRAVTMKIFQRANATPFNQKTTTPIYTRVITLATNQSQGNEFILSTPVAVSAGYIFFTWECDVSYEVHTMRWTTDPYGDRHGFDYYAADGSGSASVAGYYSPGMEITSRTPLPIENLSQYLTALSLKTSVSNTVIWQHPRGAAEMAGDNSYRAYLIGLYENLQSPAVIGSITVPVWGYSGSIPVTMRIFKRLSAGGFHVRTNDSLYSATIYLPAASYTNVIKLSTPLTVSPGHIFVTFDCAVATEINVAIWKTNTFGDRHYFLYGGTNDGNGSISIDGYWACPMIFSSPTPSTSTASADTIQFGASGWASGTVRDAILEASTDGRATLPSEFVAVVGDKLQLFVRGMVEANNPYNSPIEIVCARGNTYPRYYEYTPVVADVGMYPLTVNVIDKNGVTRNSSSCNLVVVNPVRQPATNVNILCVGDSLTSPGFWPQEFYRRVTQSGGTPAGLGYGNVSFIGATPMPTYTGQKYVGYSGWTWSSYLSTNTVAAWVTVSGSGKDITDQKSRYMDTAGGLWTLETIEDTRIKWLPYLGAIQTMPASGTLTWVGGGTHTGTLTYSSTTPDAQSPFIVNGNLSFSSWATAAGVSGGVQAAYILLGWNNIASGPGNKSSTSDYTSVIALAQQFISQIHADYPECQIRVLGVQLPSPTGGLGANYGAVGGSANFFKLLRSVNGLNLAYQDLANNPTNSAFTKFLNVSCQFDSENNMPGGTATVNSRSTATEYRGSNGIHPDMPGYMQIADVAFRDFIRTFCQ